MRKFHLIAVVSLALAAAPHCFAQKDLQNTFPSRFGSWVATNSPEKMKPNEQQAVLHTEAGMEEWFARPYSNGSQTLSVDLKRFRDPSGAYQLYTAALDTEMQPSTVGPLTAIGHGRLVMLIGNLLLGVSEPHLATTSELQELAGAVRKFADATPL